MNWKFWKKPTPEPKPPSLRKLVGGVPSSIEWRKSPVAVGQAARLLAEPGMRNMLEIVVNERPTRGALALGATEIDVARAYGYAEGYEAVLSKLLLLAEPIIEHEEPKMTFESELYPPPAVETGNEQSEPNQLM